MFASGVPAVTDRGSDRIWHADRQPWSLSWILGRWNTGGGTAWVCVSVRAHRG